MQFGGEDETSAVVIGTEHDMRFDRRLADRDFLVSGDALYRAVEARGVARGKELLRIRLAARATHLFRGSHLQIDETVGAANIAIASADGSDCRSTVGDRC